MPAGVELFNSVLNQLGSPALYSDVFANRPAFGFTGRLFISTDTNEIYRDTGTSWVLISSGGGGVNIYNSDGSLTAARTVTMANHSLTFEGGANVNRIIMSADNNVARIFSFRTAGTQRWAFRVDGNETGSNVGGDWALRAYNDAGTFIFSPLSIRRSTGEIETFAEESITTAGASIIGLYTNSTGTYAGGLTTTGGNPQTSNFNIFTLGSAGNVTFANSNLVGTTVNVIRAQVQNAGTITFPASGTGGLRAATNFVSQLQYNTSAAAGTYTHMANVHLQGVYEVSGGNLFTITNAYQLLLNSLNENNYTGAQLALTNRWGIYQDGANDLNYFAANTLLGTTTNTGERLQVAGTARVTQSAYLATASGNVGIGTTSPGYKLDVSATSMRIRSGTAGYIVGPSGEIMVGEDAAGFYVCNGFGIAPGIPISIGAQSGTGIGNTLMQFFTSKTERIRITAGGNFLIGTTSDSGNRVNVSGNINLVSATNAIRWNSGDIDITGVTGTYALNVRIYNLAALTGFDRLRIDTDGNVGFTQTTFGSSATRTLAISTGTAPGSSPADCFQLYSADITAGNAAAHFRTEGGAVIKVYQETTAVAAATLVGGGGTNITATDTFDGYTLQQVVKALRNQGLLA